MDEGLPDGMGGASDMIRGFYERVMSMGGDDIGCEGRLPIRSYCKQGVCGHYLRLRFPIKCKWYLVPHLKFRGTLRFCVHLKSAANEKKGRNNALDRKNLNQNHTLDLLKMN